MSSHSDPAVIPIASAAAPRVLPNLRVRYPRGTLPVWGLVLNRYPAAVQTHWIDGATRPHFEPARLCPGCVRRYRKRTHYYLGCYDCDARAAFLALYAENAARQCPELAGGTDPDLRGRYLTLRKLSTDPTSPIGAELTEPREASLLIPDALPTRRILEDLWLLPVGALGEDAG